MNVTLLKASIAHKTVLENLMQFYIYDFTEFIDYDVEENGLFFSYPGLDDYWKEKNNKFPYLVKTADKYVGFVLVKFIESKERGYFSIAEFFILKKFRRTGIGKSVAVQVFNLHQGEWEVHQIDSNKPARLFWKKVIEEYTKGIFKEYAVDGKQVQEFASQ